MFNLIFDKEDGTFQNFFTYPHLENTSGDMHMPSDLQLINMVPRNSMPIVKYDTSKFQVELEPD